MKPNYRKLNKDGVLWTLPDGSQAVLDTHNKMLAFRKFGHADWDWVHKAYRSTQ